MVKEREYVVSVDRFNMPEVAEKKKAIGLLLIRLLLLNPGSDPLHPDMGVGIQNYRWTMNTLPDLKARVEDQIRTYLPDFHSANVVLIITPDKKINIEITINDTVYVYDSNKQKYPIELSDLQS